MTVNTTARTAGPYPGNGAVSTFAFAFKVFAATDVLVQLTSAVGLLTVGVLNTDYTVSLNANQNTSPGGDVVTTTPLATGVSLSIGSQVPQTQGQTLTNPGGFFPTVLNDALDKLTILQQQAAVLAAGAVRVPEVGGIGVLPSAAQRASQLYGFDAVGVPTLYAPSAVNMNIVSQPQSETQSIAAGTTLVTLTTFTYPSSKANAITVFLDGQEINDFAQTSDSSLTLTTVPSVPHQITVTTNTFASFSSGRTSARDAAATSTDVGSYQFRRDVNYSGGTFGFVNSAIRADTFVNNAGATAFEWAITGVVHNSAIGGQNVGVVGYGFKTGGGVGPTFGGNFGVFESTANNDPTYGSVGCEIDNASNGTDANNNRVILDCVAFRQAPAGADTFCTYGVRVSNAKDGSHTSIGTAFMVGNSDASLMPVGVAFDCAAATISIGALRMPAGAPILFDGAGSNQLSYDGTGLYYKSGGVSQSRLNKDGSIQFGGTTLPVVLKGTTAATASIGGAGAAPAQVLGYLVATISGTTVKIPYYAN